MRVHSSGQPLVWLSALLIALAVGGCGGDDGTGPSDTTAPGISAGPTVSTVTETTAQVAWTTDEPATSQVSFGLTTTYGSAEQSATLTTEHSVLLSTLSPYTLYHFQVASTDADGNVAQSNDGQFTTDRSLGIYLSEGWQHLAGGNAVSARTSFQGALGKSATSAEAHLGVAWCDFVERNFEEAAAGFENALTYLTSQQLSLDAQVGLALAEAQQGDLAQAAVYAQSVLAQDAEYTFAYLPWVDYLDLHVVIARASYADADYTAAQEEVDYLNPHNVLDPGMSGYTVALGAAINVLYQTYCTEGGSDGGKTGETTAEW